MEHQVREGVRCYRDLRQVISVWQKYKRRELECIWNAITDEQLMLLRDRGDVVSPKVFRLNLWTFWCILFSLRKYIKMKQLIIQSLRFFIIFCVRKPRGLQPRGGITPSIFIKESPNIFEIFSFWFSMTYRLFMNF